MYSEVSSANQRSTYRHIEVHPVTSAIGAEIRGVNLTQRLPDAVVAEIKRAWLEHSVVFFRDQKLSAEQLKSLLLHFGELHETRWSRKGNGVADPYSHVLGSETDDEPEEGSFTWRPHIDNASSRIPVRAIGLCALDVPATGADTVWVSLYAAYDALSAPMKSLVEGLVVIFSGVRREQLDQLVLDGPEAWKNFRMHNPVVEHPLVHTHPETGRKALFVDSLWTWSIKNVQPEESAALLALLRHHCARPEFQVRFKWRQGSIAVWDNRCTQHFRVRDSFTGKRLLQRASVEDTQAPAL